MFSSSVSVRKLLYLISLVRSQLTYCCQIWRLHLIKDIIFIEKIQRQATNKFILNDFSSDYQTRLISLNLLPLMYLQLFDVLFFVKCLKFPDPSFVVEKFITFPSSTRSGSAAKLVHKHSSTSSSHHFYFCRLAGLHLKVSSSYWPNTFFLYYQTSNKATFLDYFYITLWPFFPLYLSCCLSLQ